MKTIPLDGEARTAKETHYIRDNHDEAGPTNRVIDEPCNPRITTSGPALSAIWTTIWTTICTTIWTAIWSIGEPCKPRHTPMFCT